MSVDLINEATGETLGTFADETAADEIARKLHVDARAAHQPMPQLAIVPSGSRAPAPPPPARRRS